MTAAASSSRTTTYTETPLVYLINRAQAPVTTAEKLKTLLASLKEACNRLPSEHQSTVLQSICEWEHVFFENSQADSALDSDRVDTAYRVVFFYNNVESIMLDIVESEDDQVAWFQAWNELKNIIAEILPSPINVDQFLETYRQRQVEMVYLLEIEKVKDQIEKLKDEFYSNANEVNESFGTAFETLKIKLKELITEKQLAAQHIHGTLDTLTNQVDELFQAFKKRINEIQHLTNRFQDLEIISEQNLQNAQDIVDRI